MVRLPLLRLNCYNKACHTSETHESKWYASEPPEIFKLKKQAQLLNYEVRIDDFSRYGTTKVHFYVFLSLNSLL